MSLPNPVTRRRAALSTVAAASLAVATLALLSPPTQAAPQSAVGAKQGYAGAPVNPTPYTLAQPDGTKLRVHRFGDALSNGVATVNGNYTIVQGEDGYWRYAAGLTPSGQLKPSGVVAGDGAPPAAAKDLAPARRAETAPPTTPKAGLGDDKELVILVSFLNSAPHTTQAEWAAKYFGATASVDDFYEEASVGQFGLAPAAETSAPADNGVAGWYELPYNHPNTGAVDAPETYIRDAILAASADVNFASFDTNTDGEINTDELHVTVIGAGYETAFGGPGNVCGGSSIWGHQWDLNSAAVPVPVVDGVEVGGLGYTTFGEMHCAGGAGNAPGHMATIGIMAHEFGHDINWPDLYDVDGTSEGIGEYSLMSGGSWGETVLPGDSPTHPDAWSLWYQGWVTPTAVTTATNDIQVDTGESVLVSPNPDGVDWLFGDTSGDGEYFLIENRQPVGYDSSLPGCGLVAYRVDETVTSSNWANRDENDPLVKVLEADGLDHLYFGTNRGDPGDPYPGSSNNHELDNATDPDTKFHTGTASNLDIHIDSNTCAATMQLDVVTPGIASPPPPRPANDNFANAVTLTGASGTTSQTTDYATREPGEPKPADVGGASVWFTWTAPLSGNLTLTTEDSDYDTTIGLYTGSAVNALTEIASNDDENTAGGIFTSKLVTPVTAGTVYRISGAGYGGDSGQLVLDWSMGLPATAVAAVHVPEPSTYGSASSINVTVSGGSGTPTGQVTLKEGTTTIGIGVLDGSGQAAVALPATTPAGSHNLTVSYPGDATHDAANGNVTATVNKAASSTSATAPRKVKYKKDFDVTATVTAPAGSNTGSVQVFKGTRLLGTGTLSNGVAVIHITKNLKRGKHTLTVVYPGSANAEASQTTVVVKVKRKKRN